MGSAEDRRRRGGMGGGPGEQADRGTHGAFEPGSGEAEPKEPSPPKEADAPKERTEDDDAARDRERKRADEETRKTRRAPR